MGDLNSYAQEDPIDAIKAGADDVAGTGDDFTNLIAAVPGRRTPTRTRSTGRPATSTTRWRAPRMVGQVTGAADWHINSDEPDVLDYDTSFKPPAQDALYEPNAYRSSDHDPVVVGIDLVNAAPSADAGGPYSVVEGESVTLSATGVDPEGTALTFAWDLDGNGTFETPGQSVTFTPTAEGAGSAHGQGQGHRCVRRSRDRHGDGRDPVRVRRVLPAGRQPADGQHGQGRPCRAGDVQPRRATTASTSSPPVRRR